MSTLPPSEENLDQLSQLSTTIGQADTFRNQWRQCDAIPLYQQALAIATDAQQNERVAYCHNMLGICMAPDVEAALWQFQLAGNLFRREGRLKNREANLKRDTGSLYLLHHDLASTDQEKKYFLDHASQQLIRAEQALLATDDPIGLGLTQAKLASLQLRMNNYAAAHELFMKALRNVEASDDYTRLTVILSLCELWIAQEEWRQVTELLAKAQTTIRHIGIDVFTYRYCQAIGIRAYCQLRLAIQNNEIDTWFQLAREDWKVCEELLREIDPLFLDIAKRQTMYTATAELFKTLKS